MIVAAAAAAMWGLAKLSEIVIPVLIAILLGSLLVPVVGFLKQFLPAMWETGRVPDVLGFVAHILTTPDARSLPAEFPDGQEVVVIALFTESWASVLDGATEEEREEAEAFCANHSVADHPLGAESKTLVAVAVDGGRYAICQARGDDVPIWMEAGMTQSSAASSCTRCRLCSTLHSETDLNPFSPGPRMKVATKHHLTVGDDHGHVLRSRAEAVGR
ncbi:hypothetical protein WJX64_02930 [Leifsonia sp. YIM 134122]|uniref:Uncharacterized protein n=1 Tax=Leifsonia stereocauli TaxID=3134136 RepID=A0ABU9W1D3_9MICO